jgi:hypothetical protein
MKKLIKRSIIIMLTAFVMLLCINLKSVTASEFTASAKGFTTKNLEYVDDKAIEDVKMISNKGYNYGSYSIGLQIIDIMQKQVMVSIHYF